MNNSIFNKKEGGHRLDPPKQLHGNEQADMSHYYTKLLHDGAYMRCAVLNGPYCPHMCTGCEKLLPLEDIPDYDPLSMVVWTQTRKN